MPRSSRAIVLPGYFSSFKSRLELPQTLLKARFQVEMLLLAATLLMLALLAASHTRAFTSDDVAQQNAVMVLTFHSRRVLDLPQNTYVLKLPAYALLQQIPSAPTARLLTAAILFNLVAFALFYWTAFWFIRLYAPIRIANTAPLVWLPSLGVALGALLINSNSRNLEIGLAFAALATMARWYKESWPLSGRRSVVRIALFAVLLGLLFYDDPYFVYTLAAPVLLFFGGKWLIFGRDKRALMLIGTALAALVFEQGWYWLLWLLGIHAGRGTAVFATADAIAHNAQLFAQGSVDVFNANFYGHSVLSFTTLALVLNFLILATTLLAPILLLSRSVRQDIWKVFLVLQPPFLALIFVLSGMVVDAESDRYLVLLPFYAAIIFAIIIPELLSARAKNLLTVALLVAAALNIASTVQVYLSSSGNPNAENQLIVQIARANHLTKGYASYWNAGINQYFADNKVFFIQSGCSKALGIRPYRLLLNEQVLQRNATTSFYLFDPATTRCTESDLKRFFGVPQTTIALPGQKRLLLYGYDISRRMVGQ